jgi:hypothetical protein
LGSEDAVAAAEVQDMFVPSKIKFTYNLISPFLLMGGGLLISLSVKFIRHIFLPVLKNKKARDFTLGPGMFNGNRLFFHQVLTGDTPGPPRRSAERERARLSVRFIINSTLSLMKIALILKRWLNAVNENLTQ